MQDLLTGEQREIAEKLGTEGLSPRHALLARVVDVDGLSLFCGMHPRPLPPGEADLIVKAVKRELRLRTRPATIEAVRAKSARLIELWYAMVADLDARPLPTFNNTDGEALELCVDHFAIAPGKRSELAARLAAIAAPQSPEEKADLFFTFTRPKSRQGWDNVIIGSARLHGERLEAEANSRRRADELRRVIEGACAGLVTHQLREHTDLMAALEQRRGEPAPERAAPTPEEQELVRQFKAQHYARWLDEPVPALAGATPREASRTAAGRRKLEQLLKEFEHGEAQLPEGERFDVTTLRSALQLERR